jgi:hypothetical protein
VLLNLHRLLVWHAKFPSCARLTLKSTLLKPLHGRYIQSVVVAGTMAGAFALLPLPQ